MGREAATAAASAEVARDKTSTVETPGRTRDRPDGEKEGEHSVMKASRTRLTSVEAGERQGGEVCD